MMVAQWIEPEKFKELKIEDWELAADTDNNNLRGVLQSFAHWFSIEQEATSFIENVTYSDYINDGTTNVETCFAIWANVIEFEHGTPINYPYAISRVKEYLKTYYIPGYKAQLENWELELY